MTNRDKIAVSILKPINPSLIIILGLYTVTWGLWLASPWWAVFTQAAAYSAMAALAPELYWGLQALVAGSFITYGAVQQNFKLIQRGAIIGFFHWFLIGCMYFIGDWQTTGGITSVFIAIYSAIVWVNLKVNREHFHYLQ